MDMCLSESSAYDEVHCVRPEGHPGLHRNAKKAPPRYGISETMVWGDNEQKEK